MLGIVEVRMRAVAHQVPRRVVAVAIDVIIVPRERQARHVLLPAIGEAIIPVAEPLRVLPVRYAISSAIAA